MKNKATTAIIIIDTIKAVIGGAFLNFAELNGESCNRKVVYNAASLYINGVY